MELTLLIILVLINLAVVAFFFYLRTRITSLEKFQKTTAVSQYKNVLALATKIDSIHKRIDAIFVIDKPQENEATKNNEVGVELDERNFYGPPPEVRIEVEGGDSQIPPGFPGK